VAITTRLLDPLPEDHVSLPRDRQGKARSGLKRRCAAVGSWQAEIAVGDVQEVVGVLSPAVTGRFLRKVSAALTLPTESHTPKPGDQSVGPPGAPPAAAPAADADGHWSQARRRDEDGR
jgi:hypothetical protein